MQAHGENIQGRGPTLVCYHSNGHMLLTQTKYIKDFFLSKVIMVDANGIHKPMFNH